jgi:hypothetical protein
MPLPLTNELLTRALVKLAKAEHALRADPTNKWLQMSVQVEKDKVESIQQSLSKSEVH